MSNLPGFYKMFNLISPPSIPTLYWDAYSHEERIKKIIDKIHAIIEYLDLITDLINELEFKDFTEDILELRAEIARIWIKIGELEQLIKNLEDRVSVLESEIKDIWDKIKELEDTISNINISGKMDKQPLGKENTTVLFDNLGNSKVSNLKIIEINPMDELSSKQIYISENCMIISNSTNALHFNIRSESNTDYATGVSNVIFNSYSNNCIQQFAFISENNLKHINRPMYRYKNDFDSKFTEWMSAGREMKEISNSENGVNVSNELYGHIIYLPEEEI